MTINDSNGNGKHVSKKEPVFVVLQLSGGNDVLNTVVPFGDGLYYDYRPTTGIAEDKVIHLDDRLGLVRDCASLLLSLLKGSNSLVGGDRRLHRRLSDRIETI